MEVLREFFLNHFKVQDPIQIDPYQSRVPSYALMRQHTWQVEVGSVANNMRVFKFQVPDENEPPHLYSERNAIRFPSDTFRALNAPMPPKDKWFCNPATGEPMEPDLDHVAIFHITTRHVWASMKDFAMPVRVGFVHQGLDRLYGVTKLQESYAKAGVVQGAYGILHSTPKEGLDVDIVAMPMARNFANYHFTSTMALVNERNLMNCILTIPGDVCARAGFAEFLPPPDPREDLIEHVMRERGCTREAFLEEWRTKMNEARAGEVRPTHYVAVPDGHVLSWGLRDVRYAVLHLGGAPVESFRFTPSAGNGRGYTPGVPVTLYYMINNLTFDAMVKDFTKSWLGRVDIRPLKSLYWDFLPMVNPKDLPPGTQQVEGVCMARSNVTYMIPPKLTQEQIDGLVPILDPSFPSSSQWLPNQ